MTGQLFGHYRIIEKIGSGGMGEVFRARDERLNRDVALKIIKPAFSDNPDHLRRFEQEARAAAALNHPNIIAIYDVGYEGKTPYIVSELLRGKDLRARLGDGPFPLNDGVGYAVQIVNGLTAAHDHHIVHRDLKPENLFLTRDGRIVILDFGVAKLMPPDDEQQLENAPTRTKAGAVIGTAAYMSPEQHRSQGVDHRSDIFGFGAIFYEMLTGHRAFRGGSDIDTTMAVMREQPAEADLEAANVPVGCREIIKHCLEKDADRRFQCANDLAYALQAFSGYTPTHAEVKSPKFGVLPWALAVALAVALAIRWFLVTPAPLVHPTYTRVSFEAGTVFAARFASGGQSIVYGAAWDGKPVRLFSTVGNSFPPQALEFADANLLGVSPSNELALALHGTHNGQMETIDGMLARAPLAGGSPKEVLANVRWADWDKAGGLAVVNYANGHSRLEYPIGKVLYETSGWISNIRFSPQADKIAFLNHPKLWDQRGTVCVVDLAGKVSTLTQVWESEQGVAWRPDGKEIWFTAVKSGNNLNLMAVDLDGKMRLLLDLPIGFTLQDIAPDGRVLVALNEKRLALAFSTLSSAGDTELSWHDWNIAKDISPDGKLVLFEDASEAAGSEYAVAIRNIDGSAPTRLGDGSAGGLSPDGQWAISISAEHAAKITLLPVGPGQPRPVDVQGLEEITTGWARFLANGKQILVNGNEKGHGKRCYVLSVDGGKTTAVTPEGVTCGPSSPDSRFLIGVDSNSAMAIYPFDGGPARSIPNLESGFRAIQWSQDGSVIFGYKPGELPSKIYKVEIATGKETMVHQLRPSAQAGIVIVTPVVVSRDGSRFAYSFNQALSTLYLISGLH
jgi:eukaryotic-like serine/threonine-protein kinase